MTTITVKDSGNSIKFSKQQEEQFAHLIKLLKEHPDLFEISTDLSEGAKDMGKLGNIYELHVGSSSDNSN
jgi:hypothetical protein